MKTSRPDMTEEVTAQGHWARLPSRGYVEGLSRSFIFGLIRAGRIRTAHIVQPGRKKGIRLVFLPSLREYIANHATDAVSA